MLIEVGFVDAGVGQKGEIGERVFLL